MAALKFVPVSRENWQAVTGLSLLPEQKAFLWVNASSLVECLYDASMQPYAILADESVVGLLVFGRDSEDSACCFIYHLMIDGKAQGKGYGKAAMQWLMDTCKEQYERILLSYEPENEAARAFYAKLGFQETAFNEAWGEMNAVYELKGV